MFLFKNGMCYAVLLVVMLFALNKASRGESPADVVHEPSDVNNSTFTDEEHSLESHEAMQQSVTNEDAHTLHAAAVKSEPFRRYNTFLDGKLVIEEQEPTVREEEQEEDALMGPEPTSAMHRTVRSNLIQKEPDPMASESLLELLVTIAGQPERWNNLIKYVDMILKSPIKLSPELIRRLNSSSYSTRIEPTRTIKPIEESTPHHKPKLRNNNRTDDGNIQHMIVLLQNQHENARSRSSSTRKWPKSDDSFKQSTPVLTNTVDNVSSQKRQRGSNFETERSELKTTEEMSKLIHNTDKSNDERNLKDYDSKYGANNNDGSQLKQDFIEELHKLGQMNRENSQHDVQNLKEYESKFNFNSGANQTLNNTEQQQQQNERSYLKRDDISTQDEHGFEDRLFEWKAFENREMYKQNEDDTWPDYHFRHAVQNQQPETVTFKQMLDDLTQGYQEKKPMKSKVNDIIGNHLEAVQSTTDMPSSTARAYKDSFAFRRVTIGPEYDKTRQRNAYIAVSVIAPTMRKYYKSHKKMPQPPDTLEDELQRLKPWNHRDNLNNMQSLRAKWHVVRTADKTKLK